MHNLKKTKRHGFIGTEYFNQHAGSEVNNLATEISGITKKLIGQYLAKH